MDAADLIMRLGGPSAVAARLGAKPGAVVMWKQRRTIPARYWLAVKDIAAEQGIDWTPDFRTPPQLAPEVIGA